MSNIERDNIKAKAEIQYILSKQGYEPYSKLLKRFYISLVDKPLDKFIGAMIPNEYIIMLNRNLSKRQASMVVRHEILHQYLDHALRSSRHLGQQVYDSRTAKMHQRLNIAQDYEISDVGYTEDDMKLTRELEGLLLCDDHPEWQGKTFEEIYDLLDQEEIQPDQESRDNEQQNQQDQENQEGESQQDDQNSQQDNSDSSDSQDSDGNDQETEYSADYIEGWNDLINGIKSGKIDKSLLGGNK